MAPQKKASPKVTKSVAGARRSNARKSVAGKTPAGKTVAGKTVAGNYVPGKPKVVPGKGTVPALSLWNHTHMPPTAEEIRANGRMKGRNLVSWTKPRMIEKTFMYMMYECATRDIRLPWAEVANRLSPGMTGAALVQKFSRMRNELIAEGHLVPPQPGPGNSNVEPRIRGHVRAFPDSDDLLTTVPVFFSEQWLHPEFNLPDAKQLVHNKKSQYTTMPTADHIEVEESDAEDNEEESVSMADEPRRSARAGKRLPQNYTIPDEDEEEVDVCEEAGEDADEYLDEPVDEEEDETPEEEQQAPKRQRQTSSPGNHVAQSQKNYAVQPVQQPAQQSQMGNFSYPGNAFAPFMPNVPMDPEVFGKFSQNQPVSPEQLAQAKHWHEFQRFQWAQFMDYRKVQEQYMASQQILINSHANGMVENRDQASSSVPPFTVTSPNINWQFSTHWTPNSVEKAILRADDTTTPDMSTPSNSQSSLYSMASTYNTPCPQGQEPNVSPVGLEDVYDSHFDMAMGDDDVFMP
ncbi:hypothetical protein F4779DRAFT_618554 [Xylariaceae sp. FL0662B]|nr:hypothetical protein F4779DRAFT_618554 [Xylariaceae sp. FL0662B]